MKEVGKVGIRPRRSAEESRVRQMIEEEEEEEEEERKCADPHRGNRLIEAKVKYQRSSLRMSGNQSTLC